MLWVEQRASWSLHFHIANTDTLKWITIWIYWWTNTNIPNWIYQLPSLNVWHNIIVTRNWNVFTTYLDWIQYAQWTNAVAPNQTYQWYIWKEYTDNRSINWTIDEVIFENKVRTQEEVTKYVHKLWL